MEISRGRGYVYSIQYHMVWCVKYRHQILSEEIENQLVKILNKISLDNGFQILEINTDKDHVHLLINCKPQHYIPDVVKALKGVYLPGYYSSSTQSLKKDYGVVTYGILLTLLPQLARIQKNK